MSRKYKFDESLVNVLEMKERCLELVQYIKNLSEIKRKNITKLNELFKNRKELKTCIRENKQSKTTLEQEREELYKKNDSYKSKWVDVYKLSLTSFYMNVQANKCTSRIILIGNEINKLNELVLELQKQKANIDMDISKLQQIIGTIGKKIGKCNTEITEAGKVFFIVEYEAVNQSNEGLGTEEFITIEEYRLGKNGKLDKRRQEDLSKDPSETNWDYINARRYKTTNDKMNKIIEKLIKDLKNGTGLYRNEAPLQQRGS